MAILAQDQWQVYTTSQPLGFGTVVWLGSVRLGAQCSEGLLPLLLERRKPSRWFAALMWGNEL